MIKLMICDDEPWICTLIDKFIDYKKYNIENVGFANDGLSAYELILEKKPDIVIVDIMMPGIDGIELIKRIWDIGMPVHFIIVSGSNSFDYARQAIKYQVRDYLMKPIDKDAVDESVAKVCAIINEQEHEKDAMNITRQKLAHTTAVARKYFLSNVIFDTGKVNEMTVYDVNREYDTEFKEGSFRFIMLCIQSDKDKTQTSEDVNRIEERFKKELLENCYTCESYVNQSQILFLLNFAADKDEQTELAAEHDFHELLATYAGPLFIRALMLTGETFDSFADIEGEYKKLCSMLPAGILKGYNCVCSFKQLGTAELDEESFSNTQKENLREILENGDEEALKGNILMLLHKNRESICTCPILFTEFVHRLINNVCSICAVSENTESEIVTTILRDYASCSSAENLSSFICAVLGPVRGAFYAAIAGEKSMPLQRAKQFIADNYAESITLEELAAEACVSPGHLSFLFKKEMDTSFVNYLTDVRIQESKILLAKTTYSISEIAEKVGYPDQKYFSRVFLKNVGLKPKEYRKLCVSLLEDNA